MNLLGKLLSSSDDICLYAKKNSGKLLSIGSSVLAVGACAGTGVATWKAKDKLEEHNDIIHDLHEKKQYAATEEDRKEVEKEIMLQYGKTGLTVLGYYAGPALLLGGSIACDIASSKEYEHKLALASGTIFLLKSAYDKAQQKAIEKYGEEEAADIFYDKKKVLTKTTDEKGETRVEVKEVFDPTSIIASNPCAILLGDGIQSNLLDVKVCSESIDHNLWININFIHSLEREFTNELNLNGKVWVKDVYKRLGVEPAGKAQMDLWNYWGWVKDQNRIEAVKKKCILEGIDPNKIDPETGMSPIEAANQVKLGIDNELINGRYKRGEEPMVWIVPNCIGDITPFIFPDKEIERVKELTAI